MATATADLCDKYIDQLSVLWPMLTNLGGRAAFEGVIATVKVHEENKLVREMLNRDGAGKVLVVDGGGSLRSALIGDQVAQLAIDQGWAGLVVNGCIRDRAAISKMPIGLFALGSNPVRPAKNGFGLTEVPVSFGGVKFVPGEYLYADDDGIVVAARRLG
jgi:regulator of ribonuclease activity A